MTNYYHDVWPKRSFILVPLTSPMLKTVKWQWTEREQKAFCVIKKHISQQVLLAYPDFKKKFDIHANASNIQLGVVISQGGKSIAYYLCNLQSASLMQIILLLNIN